VQRTYSRRRLYADGSIPNLMGQKHAQPAFDKPVLGVLSTRVPQLEGAVKHAFDTARNGTHANGVPRLGSR
jgi:hypothetical protein